MNAVITSCVRQEGFKMWFDWLMYNISYALVRSAGVGYDLRPSFLEHAADPAIIPLFSRPWPVHSIVHSSPFCTFETLCRRWNAHCSTYSIIKYRCVPCDQLKRNYRYGNTTRVRFSKLFSRNTNPLAGYIIKSHKRVPIRRCTPAQRHRNYFVEITKKLTHSAIHFV